MRRAATFLLMVLVSVACAAEARGAPYEDSLVFDLVPTITALAGGSFVLDVEAQTAIDGTWSISFGWEAGSLSGQAMFDLQIGPQIRPWGGYLTGAYVGVYPGFGSFTVSASQTDWIAGVTAEAGYEWVFDPGIVLGLSAGASWYSGSTPLSGFLGVVALRVGYAFSVAELHAR
jgi:hypothetical protein